MNLRKVKQNFLPQDGFITQRDKLTVYPDDISLDQKTNYSNKEKVGVVNNIFLKHAFETVKCLSFS